MAKGTIGQRSSTPLAADQETADQRLREAWAEQGRLVTRLWAAERALTRLEAEAGELRLMAAELREILIEKGLIEANRPNLTLVTADA